MPSISLSPHQMARQAWLRSRTVTASASVRTWVRSPPSADSAQATRSCQTRMPLSSQRSKKRRSYALPPQQRTMLQPMSSSSNGAVDPFGVAAVEGVERHPVRALDHDRLAVDVMTKWLPGPAAVMASHGGRRSLRRPHLPGRSVRSTATVGCRCGRSVQPALRLAIQSCVVTVYRFAAPYPRPPELPRARDAQPPARNSAGH